jgi:carbamoyltransferase
MKILGLHIGHDASASLIEDGEISASVAEERYTRIKHYGGFPFNAAEFCVKEAGGAEQIDVISITGHPGDPRLRWAGKGVSLDISEFEGVSGIRKFKERLKRAAQKTIELPDYFFRPEIGTERTKVVYVPHHYSHAASSWFTSGNLEKTLVITADGAGEEGNSLTVGIGDGNTLETIKEYGTKHSIGFFYGIVTEALGWWVGDGEGTTMGLAPYGDPDAIPEGVLEKWCPDFTDLDSPTSIDFGRIDGVEYLDTYHWHFGAVNEVKKLIDKYGRENLAARAQLILERRMLSFLKDWAERTGTKRLAAAGGVFLNVKLNQKIVESGLFDDLYVFPDAGDSGLSAGAALSAYFDETKASMPARLRTLRFGPSYSDDDIEPLLKERGLSYIKVDSVSEAVSKKLAEGKIVGWFQGREECGPRALGGRSILFDPRKQENKDIINSRVKYRQPFRPFCPSMTIEAVEHYLEHSKRVERFMITAYDVREDKQNEIPAVTHKDGTCRPQMIEPEVDMLFWQTLHRFGEITGTPVLMNTSFNIKGEPIVSHPRDAIKCFYDTGIDVLSLGSFIIEK